MTRIKEQPKALSEKAANILAWVHIADQPLTIDELLYSLAIRDGDTFLNHTGIPIKKTLLNCCYGLAVIDQETFTIHLVHYSLQEYLDQQQLIFSHTNMEWHGRITHRCLTFLNFSSTTTGDTPEQSSGAITFMSSAAIQWGHHLQKSKQSGVLDVLTAWLRSTSSAALKRVARAFSICIM